MPEPSSYFEKFDIQLDRQSAIFSGGERVTGKVVVVLKQPMTLKAVKLHVKGRAVCKIDCAKKDTPSERTYCDKDIVLLERPPGSNSPGHFPWAASHQYELPFECPLPRGCPTSYEGVQGHVRYFCRALIVESVDGTERERAYFTKRMLSIIAPPPLGVSESLLAPVVIEEQLNSGNCCCRNKIGINLRVPKALFVAGEVVKGSINIDKKNRDSLEDVTIRLVDRLQHNDDSQVKSHNGRTVMQCKIDAHKVTQEGSALLTMPVVAPSMLRSAVLPSSETAETIISSNGQVLTNYATLTKHPNPLFSVAYELQLLIQGKQVCALPITIGSIPLTMGDAGTPPPKIYKPFALGSIKVDEPEEKSWTMVEGCDTTFAPNYAVLPNDTIGTHEVTLTVNHNEQLSQ